ncbi:Ig kappa chain V-III region VH [Oryzias melastigma]|uniref:Ig kappa chain V-III region VH n=1 Tax=Oryzias melastigma TaxID=30732 RepID=A0A834BYB8_ORYME|nr:Ig kappa chain V-III region VH [Oryzias melastigma]
MESLHIWVILLALSGFQKPVLTMPTSTLWVRAGENATLYCPLLDAPQHTKSSPTASIISWYRTAAGQGPQMLLTVGPSSTPNVKYGAGVRPEKVSAGVNGSLMLSGFQQNDSAVYFCGMSHGTKPEKKANARSQRGH